jgi:sulfate transport system substrate-binding protein
VVDKVTQRKGNAEAAKAYLEFLYSEAGQNLAAKHYYRPRSETVLANHATRFPKLNLVTIDEAFGGWQKAQKLHFKEDGIFDQILKSQRH